MSHPSICGMMVRDGRGAPKDTVEAYMWFARLSAKARRAKVRAEAEAAKNAPMAAMTSHEVMEAKKRSRQSI